MGPDQVANNCCHAEKAGSTRRFRPLHSIATARLCICLLASSSLLPVGSTALSQDLPHLSVVQPGGMPGLPVMQGIQKTTNGVSMSWYGPSGYYQLYQKTALNAPSWQPVGGLNFSNQAVVATVPSNAFFRVSGPSPQYAGAQVCVECHASTHSSFVLTPHAEAFTNALFVSLGGQTDSSCLPCHTVGAGLPTGFVSLAKTPGLASVQCENCHGPAGNHAANPDDPTAIPRVEVAATVCGGCHNAQFVPTSVAAYHPARYEEWSASLHSSAISPVSAILNSTPALVPTCGTCHSGTVRGTLLENVELQENLPLPDAHDAVAVSVGCADCHDPHSFHVYTNLLDGLVTNVLSDEVVDNDQLGPVYTNQLRNPLASFLPYHTGGTFTTNYNPNVNLCAQCHNDRGALPTDTDFPPHNSCQYNLLVGEVGVLPPGEPTNQPATHAFLEKQCATCHVQTSPYVSPGEPGSSGHTFQVDSYQACAGCHGSAENAQNLVAFLGMDINDQIQTVTASLNQWATNDAPANLQTMYGTNAWQYTSLGGPTAAEQTTNAVPAVIKEARYNLYLVEDDGSLGVHNPLYCLELLDYANQLVQQELQK
jgi:hypothetical protein